VVVVNPSVLSDMVRNLLEGYSIVCLVTQFQLLAVCQLLLIVNWKDVARVCCGLSGLLSLGRRQFCSSSSSSSSSMCV
jgi:hypothetical protein